MIHTNYDENDWDLLTVSSHDLFFGGVNVDLGEKSNICIYCHQDKNRDELPVSGGSNVEITSIHWSPHHGPEINIIMGVDGYEFSGTHSYPSPGSNGHKAPACFTCHMSISADMTGGHTFAASLPTCVACHEDIESFDMDYVQTDVQQMLADIRTECRNRLWLDTIYSDLIVPHSLSPDDAGVLHNYILIGEDESFGVHNPLYVVALLTNT